MLGYFVLGLALLVLFLMLGRVLSSVPPRQLLAAGKWVGLGALGGATVFLAVTGRLSWAITAAAAFLPWIVRLVERNRSMRAATGARGAAGRQTSQIETATLRMTLDHQTGSLDGEILTGRHAGRWLSDLAVADLIDLRERCRTSDPDAVPLVEAYLDRHHDGWRDDTGDTASAGAHGGEGAPGPSAAMSRGDAYRVLGLAAGASDDEIRAAHRRLIAGLHPDRGGSSFLAALINRARDLLLDRRRK